MLPIHVNTIRPVILLISNLILLKNNLLIHFVIVLTIQSTHFKCISTIYLTIKAKKKKQNHLSHLYFNFQMHYLF